MRTFVNIFVVSSLVAGAFAMGTLRASQEGDSAMHQECRFAHLAPTASVR